MGSELSRAGHPMLAALLTVSIASLAQEVSCSETVGPTATLKDDLDLIHAEEPINVESQPATAQFRSSSLCVLTDEDLHRFDVMDAPSILSLFVDLILCVRTSAISRL